MDKIIPIKCGNVNCYVISGDSGSVLVDTGRAGNRDYLLNALKNYNIKLIVLTHGHNDHIANTKFLSDKLNTKIAIHESDYEFSKDNSSRIIYSKSLMGWMIRFFSKLSFKSKFGDFEPDFFLEDNQSLQEYGINALVYTLEGHTKGSIGLLVNKKDLIAGDTFMNMARPSYSLIAEDFDALKKSIEKIKKLNIETIYPGHGKPFKASSVLS